MNLDKNNKTLYASPHLQLCLLAIAGHSAASVRVISDVKLRAAPFLTEYLAVSL